MGVVAILVQDHLNKLSFLHPKERRFTVEQIHNTKEQIFDYKRAKKHKAN